MKKLLSVISIILFAALLAACGSTTSVSILQSLRPEGQQRQQRLMHKSQERLVIPSTKKGL